VSKATELRHAGIVGQEMENRRVLRWDRKTVTEAAQVTCLGRLFQARAVAAGIERLVADGTHSNASNVVQINSHQPLNQTIVRCQLKTVTIGRERNHMGGMCRYTTKKLFVCVLQADR